MQHFLSKTHKWTMSNISHHYLFLDLFWCLVDERRSSLLSNLHSLGEFLFSVAGDVWQELDGGPKWLSAACAAVGQKGIQACLKGRKSGGKPRKARPMIKPKSVGAACRQDPSFVPTKEGWKFSHAPYYASLPADCSLNPKLRSF